MTDREKQSLKIRLGKRLSSDRPEVMEIVKEEIDNTPTIAVNCKDCDGYEAGYSAGLKDAERPQGEWVKGREISRTMLGNKVEHIDYSDYTCSNCGLVLENLFYWHDGSPFYKFCPNCGADMRGGVEHGSNDR